jgi:radical SAM superfamily enzyme YgiQ (UPF0313 family)
MKKILFVHSSHYDDRGQRVVVRGWRKLFQTNVEKLGLILLAAYTPSHYKIEKVDEYFRDINFDSDADIVAVHAQLMQVTRANDIAREFKKRGKTVVMGGFLPTMHPELVENEVDAYCVGEGDEVWPQMLRDYEAGTLKKHYKASTPADLTKMPIPRYDLAEKAPQVAYPVQATRGCPFTCGYCSIIQFYEYKYRLRPIDDIVRDVAATPGKYFYFVDDNLMENKAYSKELFRKLIPLKKEWGTQCTINISTDPELLDLAYASGCRFVAVGMETIHQENLRSVSKNFAKVVNYKEAIANIHKSGIAVHALIMFGLASDTAQTFSATIEFLEDAGVAVAEFFLFTPYPKTPSGKETWDSGVVIDTDLSHFRESYVVFKHPTLSADQIQELYWETLRTFYSWKSIFKRIYRGKFRNKAYHFIANAYYWSKVKQDCIPVYFGKGNEVPKPRRRSWKLFEKKTVALPVR